MHLFICFSHWRIDTSFFFNISMHFLYINQTRDHINSLSLICRIHRILVVNSNGIRLKWSVRKLANILPLVMWRKDDIDFFDFKGGYLSIWYKYMDRSTLIFIDWGIQAPMYFIPCGWLWCMNVMIYAVHFFYCGNAFAIFQLKSINFNLFLTLQKEMVSDSGLLGLLFISRNI